MQYSTKLNHKYANIHNFNLTKIISFETAPIYFLVAAYSLIKNFNNYMLQGIYLGVFRAILQFR